MSNNPKQRSGLLYEELPEENELMLVDAEKGEVAVLNASAGAVWLLCNGRRTSAELVRLLRESLPETLERELEDHLAHILSFLGEKGLLE